MSQPSDDSLTHVNVVPHTVSCCVQGSGVISWGALASSPFLPLNHTDSRDLTVERDIAEGDARVQRLPLISLQDRRASAGPQKF